MRTKGDVAGQACNVGILNKRGGLIEANYDTDLFVKTFDQVRRRGADTAGGQTSLVYASELEDLDF